MSRDRSGRAASVSGARRIARNAGVQLAGQLLGRLLTLGFYVYMARRLGQEGFGSFVFALSLALLLTAVGEFGTDAILTREVARSPRRADDLFWSAIALKLAIGILAVGVAYVVGVAGG